MLIGLFLWASIKTFQSAYNPYLAQNYVQIYGVPGTAGAGLYSYGQVGHPPSSSYGFASPQSYAMPNQHVVQFAGPNVNGATAAIPALQAPYPAGRVPLPKSILLVLKEIDCV